MTDRDLNHLHPALKADAREWLMRCFAANLSVKIIETYRSAAAQNAAASAGKSNAVAGKSPHNCVTADGFPASRAFDFAVFDHGEYITDGADPRYRQAGEIGKDIGLEWGGDWKPPVKPDWDHLQMAKWKAVK